VSGQGRPELSVVDARGMTLAIAATRWHAEVTASLVDRAVAAAMACGVESPVVVRVAGAFELPVVAAGLVSRHDAVACLGAVIRGGTPHFEHVCDAVTAGLTRVALDSGKPVGNGVLTCNTIEEARDRCGLPGGADFQGSAEDKGWEAVVAALDTAIVLRAIQSGDIASPGGGPVSPAAFPASTGPLTSPSRVGAVVSPGRTARHLRRRVTARSSRVQHRDCLAGSC
jgi:6,7-dimethyl-8-ribityllumazine synthase